MKIFGKKQRSEDGAVAVAEPEATVSVAVDVQLASVQDEITKLQQERASLEGQSRGHAELIGALDHESVALKERLAAGDASVTPLLDTLDRKRTESTRKLDGIRSSISNLEARMAPLARRARELAAEVDQIRQDDEVVAFEKKSELLSKQVISSWETACRKSFELVSTIEDAIHSNLDDVHRSQVLALNEKLNLFFQEQSLRPINENGGWIRRETHLTRRMAVVAARPR